MSDLASISGLMRSRFNEYAVGNEYPARSLPSPPHMRGEKHPIAFTHSSVEILVDGLEAHPDFCTFAREAFGDFFRSPPCDETVLDILFEDRIFPNLHCLVLRVFALHIGLVIGLHRIIHSLHFIASKLT